MMDAKHMIFNLHLTVTAPCTSSIRQLYQYIIEKHLINGKDHDRMDSPLLQ